ncbi:MAG: four-carbon acid sugar kinase family protein [Cyanobacteriota bacterium]|nr:four-carbon acid sugar kinase family protein [Cyanobacteriota bacterium]
MAEHRLKIVVLDDDPTGSQTLHGCPLLLRWDPSTLAVGLRQPSPFLFLLTNTRALAPADAALRVREICRCLAPALEGAQTEGVIDGALVVSRGDSTLRGHFPLEVETLAEELGPVDATFLVPAFLEGGRATVDGVHRLRGQPVHETPFARDGLFAYHTSFLRDWVEEKSGGRRPASQVEQVSWRELEAAASEGPGRLALRQRLEALAANPMVVVDGARPAHLALLGELVRELSAPRPAGEGRPRRFLFQSAASLLNGLAPLPPQPLAPLELAGLRRRGASALPLPGLVVVGSHVPLADAQLERLLAQDGCEGVEVPVARVHRALEGPLPDRLLASLERDWIEALGALLARGRTPVFHTSRGELLCRHGAERRALGLALASSMARVAAALAPRLGYLISKGGITTQTLLADGLGLDWVALRGQLLPGLSLVLAPDDREGDPLAGRAQGVAGLPVLTFPGNLGDADTLVSAWRWMERG